MDFIVTKIKDVVVLKTPEKVSGEISLKLRKTIEDIVNNKDYNIVIDMSITEFIDSTGVSALISRISDTRSYHGDIKLASLTDFVKEVMDVTNLDKIFKIYNEVDEAVKA
jgi:anti-sigma B factor antagonist